MNSKNIFKGILQGIWKKKLFEDCLGTIKDSENWIFKNIFEELVKAMKRYLLWIFLKDC